MEERSEINWLTARVAYIKGLKSPTEQQALLALLHDQKDRTPQDEKKLAALARAEKATARANKARQDVAALLNAEKRAEAQAKRRARDHELYLAAGLLSLAGLVDKESGKPTFDRGELLGGFLTMAKVPLNDSRRAEWKKLGDALLAKGE